MFPGYIIILLIYCFGRRTIDATHPANFSEIAFVVGGVEERIVVGIFCVFVMFSLDPGVVNVTAVLNGGCVDAS